MLRQSPALVTSSSPSTRHRADKTLPQSSAGSESGDRHRAERVLELRGAVVSVLDRLDREDVRLLPLCCVSASAVGLRWVRGHTLPLSLLCIS